MRLTWVQVVVLAPPIGLKRRVEVGELLEVGRCPLAEQKEKEWRWWRKTMEGGEPQQHQPSPSERTSRSVGPDDTRKQQTVTDGGGASLLGHLRAERSPPFGG